MHAATLDLASSDWRVALSLLCMGLFRKILGPAPDGNHFRFTEFVSSPRIKNISLFPNHNQRYIASIPSRSEGRFMIATNVGRVAVDAGRADIERRESVR